VLRRKPFALPDAAELPYLRAVLTDGGEIAPERPAEFVEAAIRHRLVGACNLALGEGRLRLPEAEAVTLRNAEAVAALQGALLRRELAQIAAPLAEAIGAEAIALKGPAIADRFYPQRRLRPFADLDLLVPRLRLADATAALAKLGYGERVELREGFGATHGHDVHMQRPLGPHRADVELHWRVGDDPLGTTLDHATLAAESVPAGEVAALRYPAPSDQLLVCSMHLLSDRLKRLAWVEDVRRVSIALDDRLWARSFERGRELGLLWVLSRALDYAQHHLGYRRERPLPAGKPPPWGPLRAVEELDLRASLHLGRLAALPWRERPGYLRQVVLPSRAGLEGTVGGDGAGPLRLAGRHLARAARGLSSRR
jgi:Uncharacterised nucleotidyltransferase